MTHRPYPNPDRARHQLDRHGDETPPLTAWRPMTPLEQTLIEGASAMVRGAAPVLAAMVAGFKRPAGSEETSG